MTEASKKWAGYNALYAVEKEKERTDKERTAIRPIPSPSADGSPSMSDSPSTNESPSKSAALALPIESPSKSASPSTIDTPKPSNVPIEAAYRKGDSRINHGLFDERICRLEPLAQLLYFHLNRYRVGSSNLTVVLSWNRLMERIPVSESTLRRAFAVLKAAGLAFKDRDVYGKGSAQGIVFRVVTGASPCMDDSPSTGDIHKRKEEKKIIKGESASLDTKNCPDCHGTGFWYPSGIEQGVAKCTHSKLTATS